MVRTYKTKLWTRSYVNYTLDVVEAAVSDVDTGKLGVTAASIMHGIPASTLRNRLQGKHSGKPGNFLKEFLWSLIAAMCCLHML